MRLRPPSVPLITVDPYFSVWSPADCLTDAVTVHWTGHPNTILGTAEIDGAAYRFMGKLDGNDDSPVLTQVSRDCDAFSTRYTFEGAGILAAGGEFGFGADEGHFWLEIGGSSCRTGTGDEGCGLLFGEGAAFIDS